MEQSYKTKMVLVKPAEKHLVLAGEYETILLIQSGQGRANWEENAALVDVETALLMHPGTKMEVWAEEKQGMEIYELRILPELLEYLSDDSCNLKASFSVVPFECAAVQLPAQKATLFKRLFVLLDTERQQQQTFGHSISEKALLELFIVWGLRACAEEERKTALVGRKRLMVDEVFSYINAHLSEPLHLKDLAAQFYVSPEHLAREFKRHTEQTLHQYITKARLSRCQELLCDGVPISAIWSRCGFSSYTAMNRSFKHEFGVSPAEYYRKCCRRAREYPTAKKQKQAQTPDEKQK